MKSKTPLSLMEQLVMILVFTLAAAICLQGFSLADRLSLRQEARAQGTIFAQNMAELLKSCSGDYEEAARIFSEQNPDCTLYFSKDHTEITSEKALLITPLDSENLFFSSAHIQFFFKEEVLFEITAGWQEVIDE